MVQDVVVYKIVAMISIWVVGFVGGVLPYFLGKMNQKLMSVLNCFAGGVFLAGGFMHLLHDAVENEALQKWSTMEDGKYEFPYAEMFCSLGFLMVFCVEQFAHTIDMNPKKTCLSGDETFTHFLDKDEQHVRMLSKSSDIEMGKLEFPPNFGQHDHTHHHHGLPSSKHGSGAVAVVMYIALSFHSIMEGLGIGAQQHAAWGVFLAIIVHKGLAAFALGSGLLQSHQSSTIFLTSMLVFSFMSIFGIIAGWVIESSEGEESAASGICVALSSGTFMYVALMEIIPQEFANRLNTGQKTVAMFTGYAIFGMLAKWT